MALLEADVNFTVVKNFTESVKSKAVGREVLESLTPGQQFISIVRDELVQILGGNTHGLELGSKPPAPIMLVGLQGSGKTTTTAKLPKHLKPRDRGFDESVGITGIILTKLDGDTRGGAALSMKAVTGKPIKFIGEGEKIDALEPFHPDRMARRILGMGGVLPLIEKAQGGVGGKKAKGLG